MNIGRIMSKNSDTILMFSGVHRTLTKTDHTAIKEKVSKADLKRKTYDLNFSFPALCSHRALRSFPILSETCKDNS